MHGHLPFVTLFGARRGTGARSHMMPPAFSSMDRSTSIARNRRAVELGTCHFVAPILGRWLSSWFDPTNREPIKAQTLISSRSDRPARLVTARRHEASSDTSNTRHARRRSSCPGIPRGADAWRGVIRLAEFPPRSVCRRGHGSRFKRHPFRTRITTAESQGCTTCRHWRPDYMYVNLPSSALAVLTVLGKGPRT